ncbi:hypothetical protein ACIGXM_14045 [Kitasatospora sp. NPDC052896]|uniref:hypothetical protein n=1 Tax=Kitasatospora sp. NPDC052896 TaxID=3364061 RepID=UPI0037C6C5BA
MAMSRKHYRETAAILRHAAQSTTTIDQLDVLREIAEGVARMFKGDNPRFDRQRFMDAVFEDI